MLPFLNHATLFAVGITANGVTVGSSGAVAGVAV